MRNQFRHYYRPSEARFRRFWSECIFVLDSNVLLDVYRYTPNTRDKFLSILELLKGRLWIPYQVGREFHENRIGVILEQKKPYESIIKSANDATAGFKDALEKLNIRGNRSHPYIDQDLLTDVASDFKSKIEEEVNRMESKHPDYLKDDELLIRITELFKDCVGKPYDQEELTKAYKQTQLRYSQRIPPGYKDMDKGEPVLGESNPRAFGDAIMWFQILDFADSHGNPIILVTSDVKEDWWLRKHGKTIGPRPELVKELSDRSGSDFYMYQTSRFLEYAQNYLDVEQDSSAVEEVRGYEIEEYALSQIIANWSVIRKATAEYDHTLAPLLVSARPVDLVGNELILAFDYRILKDNFERREGARLAVTIAIEDQIGLTNITPIPVVIDEYYKKTQLPPPPPNFEEEEIPF